MKKTPVPRYKPIGVEFLNSFPEANIVLSKQDGSHSAKNDKAINLKLPEPSLRISMGV
jgi:hypothetical protein